MNRTISFLSQWLSQSGDFTFWGILITIFYAAAVIASWRYIRILKGNDRGDERLLWTCILVFLAVIGINKQLDLQILLTMAGRYVAEHQGWIEYNRAVQKFFAVGVVICLSAAVGVVLFRIRKVLVQSIAALAGVAILVFFTVVRVASINHLEKAVAFQEEKVTRIHSLELLGLVVILAALVHRLKKHYGKKR